MKILFLSTWYPWPVDNGAKIRVYHLLRALGKRHDVSLLSFAFGSADPAGSADALRGHCTDVQAVPGNPFVRSRAANWRKYLSIAPAVTRPVPEMALAARRAFERSPFDVAIASFEIMATYALMAPPSTVKVLEEHNSLSRWMHERYQDQTDLLQRLRCWVSWQKARRYEASLFPRFDLCCMVSDRDREASLELLPGRRGAVEVVPNGVDCRRNVPGLAQPAPDSLVYSGSLTYQPNYDAVRFFLASIKPRIEQSVPDVELTVTGSVEGVDLSGLPPDGRVRFSGYVDDVRPLVAAASVCIVPLRQGGGTRLKILEAMALGTPVVSTTKGAEGLAVNDGEHILLADDPALFADHVARLLRDPALRQRLAANARRLVEHRYDWDTIGQGFVELVESTVDRAGGIAR